MHSEKQNQDVPEYRLHPLAPRRHRYVVLIPVLNEGERIRRQLDKMKVLADQIDLVVVDGGSDDGSLDLPFLCACGVRALAIKIGPGRLSAQLRVGIGWALDEGYEGVVLIDGNDKDDSSAIPLFTQGLDDGYDHLQGSRYVRGGVAINTPLARSVGVRVIHAPILSLAARFRYTDTTNGFRAYSRHLLMHPAVQPLRNIFVAYELHYYLAIRAARLGFRVKEIPVTRCYPKGTVPTKIKGWRGNIAVLRALLQACFGRFNPPEPTCVH